MLNQRPIIVFDFETNGLDIPTLEPIQIAAMAVNPRTLKPAPGGTFASLMKPLDLDAVDNTPEKRKALSINGKTKEELATAPAQEQVWQQFAAFIRKYNPRNSPYSSPIPAGKNIRGFDLPISNRLCQTYGMVDKKGVQTLWDTRRALDLDDIMFLWFENQREPANYKMDTLRPFFGLSTDGAHDALVDVQQTYILIRRFLEFKRKLAETTKFAGSCGKAAA